MRRLLTGLLAATALACSSAPASDGGAGGGGGGAPYTGFDCRTSADPWVCTAAGAWTMPIGTCGDNGVCLCQPGYVRSPLDGRCWPQAGFCPGPDGGLHTATGVPVAPVGHCNAVPCPTGGSCLFDAGPTCVAPPDGGCVQSVSCGLVECRAGCRCDSQPEGRCLCDGPDACVLGSDETCNDDPAMSSLAGTCVQAAGSPRRCLCKVGFERNPATGKCRAVDAGP